MIGYGSQGRTHALNLRDSGVTDIVVGLKPGSKTRAVAEADGFTVMTAGEAAAGADVVAVMTSDEAHRDLWRDELAPTVRPGAALVFAHGLSVRFGLVEPRADLDVILASPKGIGPRIRDLYEAGEGVFCLFGVHQDATGGAPDLMYERGIAGAFAKISNTAEYGAYRTGPRVIGVESRAAMDQVLAEVQGGGFVRDLMADYDAGSPDLMARRAALGRRPIEAVGARLNAVTRLARETAANDD